MLTNQSKSRGELLRPHVETSKLADLNKDVNLKLIQLKTVHLLFLAFSSLLYITASTPTAKQHHIIVLLGGLAVCSHFEDLSSRVKALPYFEQRALNAVYVCC